MTICSLQGRAHNSGGGLDTADPRTGWDEAGSARPVDEKSLKHETAEAGQGQGCTQFERHGQRAPSRSSDIDRKTGRPTGRVADSSAQ